MGRLRKEEVRPIVKTWRKTAAITHKDRLENEILELERYKSPFGRDLEDFLVQPRAEEIRLKKQELIRVNKELEKLRQGLE